MKKVMGLILGVVPFSINAQCIQAPDCASIGYTETSCDGDSLKCPFDISKLYCVPCDSSFKHSCIGSNIVSGIGAACNNKYVTCECDAGAIYASGECICNTSCDTIGNIYYSDGTCSSCFDKTKTPVGIVAYKDDNKHLIMNLMQKSISWSANQTDTEGNVIIEQYTDLNNLVNYATKEDALTDYNGALNTQEIVNAYGEDATNVAAVYCHNYTPNELESSKGQWYLPAIGELYTYIYQNKIKFNNTLSILNLPLFNNGPFWSSTEFNYCIVWHTYMSNGSVLSGGNNKHLSVDVRCLLNIT